MVYIGYMKNHCVCLICFKVNDIFQKMDYYSSEYDIKDSTGYKDQVLTSNLDEKNNMFKYDSKR